MIKRVKVSFAELTWQLPYLADLQAKDISYKIYCKIGTYSRGWQSSWSATCLLLDAISGMYDL